ncbi:hypothetical protein AB0M39_01330 [Streptomyces sp. NPDC051907]|uniref:hypothetical protein n=1 Tax=Streptomyces sp. NPDC051907 TaxID=3155284 RepID=UPI00343B39FD
MEDRLREALLVQRRSDRIEPPGRIERIVDAARARADRVFCAQTVARLGEVCARRLLDLVAEGDEDGTALLAALKRDPGAVGLDSLLTEITKLTGMRQLGLPEGLFAVTALFWSNINPYGTFRLDMDNGSTCCLPWRPGRTVRRMTAFKQLARHPAAEPEQHRRPRREHPHPSMDVIQAGASW